MHAITLIVLLVLLHCNWQARVSRHTLGISVLDTELGSCSRVQSRFWIPMERSGWMVYALCHMCKLVTHCVPSLVWAPR